MRRVRSRHTSPEIALRKALHALGLRYSLRRRLPGSPDIVLVRSKVAVFVDGCFWHGCPRHCRVPATNRAYWRRKIERNRARDVRATKELRRGGWRVVRVWEHAVSRSPEVCAERIRAIVAARVTAGSRGSHRLRG